MRLYAKNSPEQGIDRNDVEILERKPNEVAGNVDHYGDEHSRHGTSLSNKHRCENSGNEQK